MTALSARAMLEAIDSNQIIGQRIVVTSRKKWGHSEFPQRTSIRLAVRRIATKVCTHTDKRRVAH
jgi:hypothetical protein